MNPIAFAVRRPVKSLVLLGALASAVVLGLSKMGVEVPSPIDTNKAYAFLDQLKSYLHMHQEEHHEEAHTIVATEPQCKSVTLTQQYVCQIHSQRHIKVRALETGLSRGDHGQGRPGGEGRRFAVQGHPDALPSKSSKPRRPRPRLAQLEYNYTKKLYDDKVVSENEVALLRPSWKRPRPRSSKHRPNLNFATVTAPFDGIIDRLHHQQGSLVEEGEILTTLSDNSVMWVYFNVPEARYLEYMGDLNQTRMN